MKSPATTYNELFYQFQDNLFRMDPVYFCAKYLKVDGNPLQLVGTGFKPFQDIYRYIGISAIEKNSKPIVMVKGRQVGATIMAAALECYFTACGRFGTHGRPPMRLMHLFPTLSLAAAYTKDKLDPMIGQAAPVPGTLKKNGLPKSFMENMLDTGSPSNNSMHFKKFMHGNQIWIESTGLDGDRIRGRQLNLETEIPTPDQGFVKLKNLKEGDKLFDDQGNVCTCIKLHPISESPESYRVTFDDGTIIEACAEHLWLTYTKKDRDNLKSNPTVKNTKEILETLIINNEYNHSIPVIPYAKYDEKELLINPYVLGLWLGSDLSVYEFIIDSEFLDGYNNNNTKLKLAEKLKKLNLINNKHIPNIYLQSSYNQRLALLHGLIDVNGCSYDGCLYEFAQKTSNEDLNNQVKELISSLGIKYKDKHQATFYTDKLEFGLKRKPKNNIETTHRFIKSIELIPSVRMRCITVDSPSHLYLVTRSYIITHNTVDCTMFDECFPYNQLIATNDGNVKIGKLYDMFTNGSELPLVSSYNESSKIFEFKKITNAWNKGKQKLIKILFGKNSIKCTDNHPFLTDSGWIKAKDLVNGDLVVTLPNGLISVDSVNLTDEFVDVYDIEVEDNHNFIAIFDNSDLGVVVHNCQDMTDLAIGAATKILAQSRYGARGEGIQVYFGTPKTKGGSYWEMWQNSSQQYFHLRCEKCGTYFPLYRPDVNWENIWVYGMTVRCTECAHEQDKNEAVERGKWIPLNDPNETDFIGYHFNQLYIPTFTRETIMKAKPDRSPINTERVYMNEVLGEFYDGEGGTITSEQIRSKCIDKGRKMMKYIYSDSGKRVYAGFDWGQRGLLEQMTGRGSKKGSYSCAVILTAEDNIFNIEFATRLMKADPETKESAVEEMFRRYNMALAVGDIGDAYDLTHRMQRTYDEKFLASRAQHRVIGHVKYSNDEWPKTIVFEKDYYIGEVLGLLKEGRIKFPGGHYHKIEWLIEHCASMDIKVTKDKSGEPIKKYVKGSGANDGLMALLNAYLAWKFDVTQGFSIKNPLHMKYEIATEISPIQAVIGYVPRMSGRG
jgi:intein/homing endonuclease